MLVVGAKGSGKSTLVRTALQQLESEYDQGEYIVVHLNGFIQTDDRITLTEITRQLQLEDAVGNRLFSSFAENLAFILGAFKDATKHKLSPIIMVLEEFDLFTQHKNQTLLYNLFDITQASKAPLTVVGVTRRLDVMELFEKRVKSRFSHRQLYINNTCKFDHYHHFFIKYLTVDQHTENLTKKSIQNWNKHVEELCSDDTVVSLLKTQFNISKEPEFLKHLLILPIAKLSSDHPRLSVADLKQSHQLQCADSKVNMLLGLSVLELCLLIAMDHLSQLYVGETLNLQMALNEFLKFSKKKSHILHNYTKPVILKAFEHLVGLELLRFQDSTTTKLQMDYRPIALQVDHNQIIDAVNRFPDCPTDVKMWATSSVLN